MATDREPSRSEKRERRLSTRMGIALLIALVILVIAVVCGIERWSEDDDMEGPSVYAPATLLASHSHDEIAA